MPKLTVTVLKNWTIFISFPNSKTPTTLRFIVFCPYWHLGAFPDYLKWVGEGYSCRDIGHLSLSARLFGDPRVFRRCLSPERRKSAYTIQEQGWCSQKIFRKSVAALCFRVAVKPFLRYHRVPGRLQIHFCLYQLIWPLSKFVTTGYCFGKWRPAHSK